MTTRIGTAVSTALAENGWTAAQLARLMGMSPDGVYKAAAGKRVPALSTAARMAELLGAPSVMSAVIAARTKSCETCAAPFVDNDRANMSRCCSARCFW